MLEVEETASLVHQLVTQCNRGIIRKAGADMIKNNALALGQIWLCKLKVKKEKEKEKNAGRGSTITKLFFMKQESDGGLLRYRDFHIR